MNGTNPTGSTPSPAATPGGANVERVTGALPSAATDPRAVLAAMEEQRSAPAAPEPKTVAPSSAHQDDPENPTPPVETDEPGQETLPPAETPTEEETSAEADDSQIPNDSPAAEIEAAMDGLDESQRSQLLDMLKDVKEGKANWGDLKRGHKLIGQYAEQLNELKEQIAQLTADKEVEATVTPTATNAPLPAKLASLKTLEQVQERMDLAVGHAEALQDFLDENPGDANTVYTIGDQELTRKQLIERKQSWRAEAKALPKRYQEIQGQQQFTQAQAEARKQSFTDFPWLKDPEHPEAKTIAQTLKDVPSLKNTLTPEYWAAVYQRGMKAMQAELAARKNGGAHGVTRPTTRPTGKVPLGKPHSGGANGAARPAAATVTGGPAALARVKNEGSADSFAALLEATGR